MKRWLRSAGVRVAGALFGAALFFFPAGCSRTPTPSREGPFQVAASIFPLADAARVVGGENVTVTTLLPAGRSPHGYQLKPRQVEAVASARLLLVVGLGMDEWAEQAARVGGGRLEVLRMADVVGAEPLAPAPEAPPAAGGTAPRGHPPGAAEHKHHHTGPDPHFWLDPVLMRRFVKALGGKLARLDPENAARYRRRQKAYEEQLERLHEDYSRTLAAARRREFVSFHSAFTYTAARYGLEQMAVLEAGRGEISARHLEEVIEFIRRKRVKVVFAEPQFPADKLLVIRRETGAAVGVLDPLGNPEEPGRDSYLALMRTNLAVLAEALECEDVSPASRPAP